MVVAEHGDAAEAGLFKGVLDHPRAIRARAASSKVMLCRLPL